MNEFSDQRKTTKVCSTCKRELSVNLFSRNGKRLRSNCKSCARGSKSDWYNRNKGTTQTTRAARKRAAMAYTIEQKNKPCHDCSRTFHPCLMDFDHRDPETKWRNIAFLTASSYSNERIQQEIDKCDLVCCMCHRIRTWNRRNPNEQI